MSTRKIREYAFVRDEEGMPTKIIWIGDYDAPHVLTKAEKEAAKLVEHEEIYGKRSK